MWSDRISPEEFDHPDKLDPRLIDAIGVARERVGLPFTFTKSARGQVYHRNGDACPPESTAHSDYSIHLWGIDHTASYAAKAPIADPDSLAKALDFHVSCPVSEWWEVVQEVNASFDWGGFGVYPHWNTRGFHVDVREGDHAMYGIRWHQDVEGGYRYHPERLVFSESFIKGELAAMGIPAGILLGTEIVERSEDDIAERVAAILEEEEPGKPPAWDEVAGKVPEVVKELGLSKEQAELEKDAQEKEAFYDGVAERQAAEEAKEDEDA